ncbi:MAG: hypothetical protein SGARI_002796 [Bacillariaceae sp.]
MDDIRFLDVVGMAGGDGSTIPNFLVVHVFGVRYQQFPVVPPASVHVYSFDAGSRGGLIDSSSDLTDCYIRGVSIPEINSNNNNAGAKMDAKFAALNKVTHRLKMWNVHGDTGKLQQLGSYQLSPPY